MRALQTNIGYIPASVFIGDDRKSILFVKHGNNNFIDYTDGNEMAAWTCNALCIGEKEYAYNTWHNVKDDEVLNKYFKIVLKDSLEGF